MANGQGDTTGNRYRRLLAERLKVEIKSLVACGMKGWEIEERHGVAQSCVSQIMLGRWLPSIEKSIDLLESMGVNIEIKDRAVK